MANFNEWAFLRSGLRRMWVRHPARTACLLAARRNYIGENKRQKYEYQCNIDKLWYKYTEVQVDHIIPCGSLLELSHIEGFVTRLFFNPSNLQVICRPCHKIKTKIERGK